MRKSETEYVRDRKGQFVHIGCQGEGLVLVEEKSGGLEGDRNGLS